MSILKKATIALTVAVFLFLSTPVFTHAAAADTCRHEHLTSREEHRFQGTETMDIEYEMDVDGDGVVEKVFDRCRHGVLDVYRKYRCDACLATVIDWKCVYRYYTSHSDNNCKKIGLIEYY